MASPECRCYSSIPIKQRGMFPELHRSDLCGVQLNLTFFDAGYSWKFVFNLECSVACLTGATGPQPITGVLGQFTTKTVCFLSN